MPVANPLARHKDLLLTGGGMLALMAGRKGTAITLFSAGFKGLEDNWRQQNPDFDGDWRARWARAEAFYEETHRNETNRWLHIVGIPIIVGGTVGLLAARPWRPAWLASLGAFSVGWGLNFIGHGVFEKAAPAFRDDPLSFIAGPVWDLRQLRQHLQGAPVDEAERAA